MKGFFLGLIILLVGLLLLNYHSSWAKGAVERQNVFWGFHFGERERKIADIGAVIMGVICIAVGLLAIFQKIKIK